MENKKWYYDAPADQNPVMPQHAIVDEDGYTVVGLTNMSEETAREIVRAHNAAVQLCGK